MTDSEQQKNTQTEFNMGMATLMRMDTILQGLNRARVGSMHMVRYDLTETLFFEVRPYLDIKEQREIQALLNLSDKRFAKLRHDASAPMPPSLLGERQLHNLRPALLPLDEAEHKLRQAMRKHGLLVPTKSDQSYALGGS